MSAGEMERQVAARLGDIEKRIGFALADIESMIATYRESGEPFDYRLTYVLDILPRYAQLVQLAYEGRAYTRLTSATERQRAQKKENS